MSAALPPQGLLARACTELSAADAANLAALGLLFAGHLLAEFVVQSIGMVEGKRRVRARLWQHALQVGLVHAAVLLAAFPQVDALMACAWLGVAHFGIDAVKLRLEARWPRPLTWLALDQLGHALAVGAVWLAVTRTSGWTLALPITPLWVLRSATVVGIVAFNVHGGSAIVAGLLAGLRTGEERGVVRAEDSIGRRIGVLERLIVLTLVWRGEWSAVGFVLTAKSVARFRELEDRTFAEAYLIGTLSSVLVAGACGLLLEALVG